MPPRLRAGLGGSPEVTVPEEVHPPPVAQPVGAARGRCLKPIGDIASGASRRQPSARGRRNTTAASWSTSFNRAPLTASTTASIVNAARSGASWCT